ncbi:MAG: peptide ABC transporter substrate-binding protein, partial [Tepidisphaeraceae bacterium]
FYPLHEPSMRKYARTDEATGRVTYDQGFTKPPDLVTNGPYRLASWEFKKRLRLVANQHYWDAKNVKLRVMDQISAEDPFTAFTIYDTGGVDWLSEVHPDVGAALRQIGRPDLRVFSGFGTYFYSLNCQPKLPDGRDNPLKDVRVRRALAMSIDKRPIVENVTRLGESVATTYIPRGIFKDYPSPAGLPFDLARARQELSDAGFPGGRGFPRLTLLFNTGAHHADVAQIIQRQWKQNLGIEVDLEGVEVKDFGNRLRTQQYMIARASWIGDYTDPSTFTDKYLSVSDNNDAKWLNKEYDDLCAQAAVEPDQAKRLQLLARAETILLEAAPIIPMYSYGNSDLVKPYVSGIPKNPRNMINFKSVEVRR